MLQGDRTVSKTSFVSLIVACVVVVVASFLPWITFKTISFQGNMPGMQEFLDQAMTINAWEGHIRLFGLTLPSWMVPIAAGAVAMLALLRSAEVWETPRGIGIALATFCVLHLGVLLFVIATNPQSTRIGLGAMLAALGSLAMLGLTIFGREQRYEPVRMSYQPVADMGPLPRVEPHMD